MSWVTAAKSLWLERDLTSRRKFLAIVFSLMAYSKKNKKDFQQTVTPRPLTTFIQIT